MEATTNSNQALTGVTLKGLKFVSSDGTTVMASLPLDNLTLEGCTFTGPDNASGLALYIHYPNITIKGCTFTNWERGYYTCGDNSAAGKMHITNNVFNNVKIPIDGYWGKAATETTDIQITGNTFNRGATYSSVYVQLWDYAQYLGWQSNTTDEIKSAIKATVKDNIYNCDFMLMATHWNWYAKTDVTLDEATAKDTVYMQLVEVDKGNNASVQLIPKEGTELGFEDHTTTKQKGGKEVFYAIPVGSYDVQVTPKENDTPIVLETTLEVKENKAGAAGSTDSVQKLTLPTENVTAVAEVGDKHYTTLAKAVEAVTDTGEIKLLEDNNEEITVSRTVTFTLVLDNHTFSGEIKAGANTRLDKLGNAYQFTYSKPSSGGGGSYAPSGHEFTTTLQDINKVSVGGKVLDSKYYTVIGTNVIISQEYIDTLSDGNYKVVIENATHIATGTLKVSGNKVVQSAKTFDAGVAVYGAMALMSAAGAVYVGKKKRR